MKHILHKLVGYTDIKKIWYLSDISKNKRYFYYHASISTTVSYKFQIVSMIKNLPSFFLYLCVIVAHGG
jgi:hypothetical protein